MAFVSTVSAHRLALLAGWWISVAGLAFMSFLLLGLGASGLAPWELWLMGHEPPSLQSGSA